MGQADTESSHVDDRRQFIKRLQDHGDVSRLDFTRDGFRTVFVEVQEGSGFHNEWQQTARRLGYEIEHRCAGIYRLAIE